MPKTMKSELLKLKKLVHPKSRKTSQISKKLSRFSNREKTKLVYQVRQSLLVDKLLWFRDHLEPGAKSYSPDMLLQLLDLYLHRFDDELEQIKLKHSVGGHRGRQHASREDTVKLTVLQDEEEFNTCGIELPDLMSTKQLHILRTWDGDSRFLQHFKLQRFAKKWLLSKLQKCISEIDEKDNLPGSSTTSSNLLDSEIEKEVEKVSENPLNSEKTCTTVSTNNEESSMKAENQEVDQNEEGKSKPENKISEVMEVDSQ